MASTKAGGSTKNLRDSNAQYLGVKITDGETVRPGMTILRQRGTKVEAGKNVRVAKDHTLFAIANGTVKYRTARKIKYDGRKISKKVVDII